MLENNLSLIYLLHKYIKDNTEIHDNLPICSFFWLPAYQQNILLKEHSKFLDQYIKLVTVDFETVAQDYIAGNSLNFSNKLTSVSITKGFQYQPSWLQGDDIFHHQFGIGKIIEIDQQKVLHIKFKNTDQIKLIKMGSFYLREVKKVTINNIDFSVGNDIWVFHNKYGKGKVIGGYPSHSKNRLKLLVIEFGVGQKTVKEYVEIYQIFL
ncbi:MAG: hypothetical protein AB4041_03480 [Microcystaceae cyanobacterium]